MNADRLSRRVVAVLGTLVLALGLVGIVISDLFEGVLPANNIPVMLAGTVAFLLGLWGVRTRYREAAIETVVPDVEFPLPTPAPGHELDDALYRLTTLRQGTTEIRDTVQERLGEVAVAVIRQREQCSRDEAVRKLQEGSWTEDDAAAGFFAGGSAPGQSFVEKHFGETTVYEEWVARTVDAIAARADMEGGAVAADGASSSGSDEDADGGDQTDRTPASSKRPIQPGYRTRSGDDEAETVAEGVRYAGLVTTGQWTGIGAFALVAVGIGLVTFNPAVFLVSAVGVGFSAYARAATDPDLRRLAVEREYSDEDADPGEIVEVTVTVTNEGASRLPDLRLIDRVPGAFRVVDGSPRLGTTLGAGDSAQFAYEVIVERGVHEWPMLAIGRDMSGSIEREATIEPDEEFTCFPSLRTVNDMPVRSQTSLFSGQVDTDIGGSGLEFFSVREYREGDPMNRIDWKRHARTGELATIDFRLERAAQVVLLFDARDSAFLSPKPTDHHALDRSVQAAGEVFAALQDRGDLVGVAAFDTVPCWLGPGAGDGHVERARQLFATHPALTSTPPQLLDNEGHYVDPMTHVRRQLSADAQVILFSPLCDDYTSEVARQLDSAGHPVTIVSPNPTADRTVGQRLARIEREMRVAQLRERGIRIIDWEHDQMLGLSLDRAKQRWAV